MMWHCGKGTNEGLAGGRVRQTPDTIRNDLLVFDRLILEIVVLLMTPHSIRNLLSKIA